MPISPRSIEPLMERAMKKKTQSPEAVSDAPTPSANNQVVASPSERHWPFDNGSFAPLNSLRREVDDIFNQFTDRFGVFSRSSTEAFRIPALDVDETETSFEISAELPGVAENDIDISVTDSVLTIHGEKQQSSQKEDADQRISECSYGVYERSLSLPFNCDAKSIEAQYDNGVLHLSIPKPKQVASKPQKVAIKSTA